MTRVLGYRFPNKAHFASWNGTAPIHASSGDVPREADATGPLTIGAEVDGLARGLLTGQLDDGGWNCETENGATSWPGERCLLENTHPGETRFEFEDGDGRPSRWNTLRAVRVLDW